ncbi:MAG: hypothetical protein KBT87_03950 [Gammaproteobacteria bacterium]|nr:hypothetical protein [Gammaproteobacteria bacterium]MBQ0773807.1 hypothetical protein [Gammaproteobacteria bacterium]
MTGSAPFEKSTNKENEDPTCSFCGRKRSESKAMFRSETARICDRCIAKMKKGKEENPQ